MSSNNHEIHTQQTMQHVLTLVFAQGITAWNVQVYLLLSVMYDNLKSEPLLQDQPQLY